MKGCLTKAPPATGNQFKLAKKAGFLGLFLIILVDGYAFSGIMSIKR